MFIKIANKIINLNNFDAIITDNLSEYQWRIKFYKDLSEVFYLSFPTEVDMLAALDEIETAASVAAIGDNNTLGWI